MFLVNDVTTIKKEQKQKKPHRANKKIHRYSNVSITIVRHISTDNITVSIPKIIETKVNRKFNKKLSNINANIPSRCGCIIRRLSDSVQLDDQFFLS